jgi:urea transport system substrate-binding protein
VVKATLAAIEEINEAGGIMGQKLEPIVADGESNPVKFGQKAAELIEKNRVSAIFGCWTSASRKEVKPVVEKHDSLLLYPVQYEGAEESSSIIYLGQLPNQQLKPAVLYATQHFGNNIFLVGSDYIFPRVANLYVKDIASLVGAKIVGERYEKLDSYDFKEVVLQIKAKKPSVILNTLNGDSNIYFFKELYEQGISSSDIPVISFSIAKEEIASIAAASSPNAVIGHFASWSYFDAIDSKENLKFKELMKKRGIQNPTDPMEAAYVGVWLYKQAVEECGSFEPSKVKKALRLQSFKGPGGVTTVTDGNLNTWKNSRIGRINYTLGFDVIEESKRALKPQNYPEQRTKREWEDVINGFYKEWGNSWVAPK